MKKLYLTMASLLLSGCASVQPEWVSWSETDEFTDNTLCRATVGSIYSQNSVYTMTGNFYPFIEKVNGEIIVGLTSGGKVKMPVGDIQLRIDNNKAWDINTDETPADPDNLPKYMQAMQSNSALYTQNLSDEEKKLVEDAFEKTSNSTAKMVSTFTATTGEKALLIINEMLQGKEVIYRTKGFINNGSTTGRFKLDSSLPLSMEKCGINISELSISKLN